MLELVAVALLSSAPKQGVDGGLPLAWVDDVIAWRANELSACFPPKSKRTTIQYSFGVAPSGRVERMSLGEVKGEWERVTCVGTVVESLAFPVTDAGTSVTWNFAAQPTRDAGVPEERILDVVDVPTEWTEDVTNCVASLAHVKAGRITASVEMSAHGFAFAAQVTSPEHPAREALEKCLLTATRSWRLATGKRARVVAGWIVAPTEREAKRFFDPTSPAVEVVLENARASLRSGGGLFKSVIMKEITRNNRRVRVCYEFVLQRVPHAGGKLAVAWTIGPEGNVVQSEITEDTTEQPEIGRCVIGVVNAMQFPKPEGGGVVNVTFPWIFKAAGSDD
ncbi:MAG: AgmX/PglI C-terminal domain-containing protein [Archangium sp.]|nr:AgmX/PglI C-terminal domain-containing protein [Archangium sp.]